MKVFCRRPGVELLEISGEYLLVATKDARDACPYVTQINEAAAEYWRLLDRRYTVNEFVEHVAAALGREKKDLLLPLLAFFSKLSKSGYLLEEDAE